MSGPLTAVRALEHARSVTCFHLTTAEKWRYDAVLRDFNEMIQIAKDRENEHQQGHDDV